MSPGFYNGLTAIFCSTFFCAPMASARNDDPDPPMLSFPAAAGEAVRAEAMVAFVSDGYAMGGCKTVKSSGNEAADEQACKTVSFYKTKTPLYATTSVWIAPTIQGEFIAPYLENPQKVANATAYPRSAMMSMQQGTTTARLVVDAAGMVTACDIAQSSGYRLLDRRSCRQLKKGRFRAASLDGSPVEAVVYTIMYWTVGASPPRN